MSNNAKTARTKSNSDKRKTAAAAATVAALTIGKNAKNTNCKQKIKFN